jgi:hypothetical protein
VGLHDVVHDQEPQPCAAPDLLRGVKRVKSAGHHLFGHAAAAVDYLQSQPIALGIGNRATAGSARDSLYYHLPYFPHSRAELVAQALPCCVSTDIRWTRQCGRATRGGMQMSRLIRFVLHSSLAALTGASACAGEDGAAGAADATGPAGPTRPAGPAGAAEQLERGPGACGSGPDVAPPLSSLVALAFVDGGRTGATNLAAYVKALVHATATGTLAELVPRVQFPLANAATDSVRTIRGLRANVVVRWLDPLTFDDSIDAPRFGANADYIAYFGDGYNYAASGEAPQFNRGSDSTSGYVWVNHEGISGDPPTATSAPTGQHVTLARYLRRRGALANDVDSDLWDESALEAYIDAFKRQLGGSFFHIVQDPASGQWTARPPPAVTTPPAPPSQRSPAPS